MHYELSVASRKFVYQSIKSIIPDASICCENIAFTPPPDGGMWFKFDYSEAETVTWSLSRKCKYYIGMVQVSVFVQPGQGLNSVRLIANQLATLFDDGTILDTGYIYEGGVVNPSVKSKSGWFIPVRFYVRLD